MRHVEENVNKETDIDNMYSKVNPQNKRQMNTTKENTNLTNGTYGEVRMLENDTYNAELPQDSKNKEQNKHANKNGKSKAVETDLGCTGTYSEVKMQENDIYNHK